MIEVEGPARAPAAPVKAPSGPRHGAAGRVRPPRRQGLRRFAKSSPLLHPAVYSSAPIVKQLPIIVGVLIAVALTSVIPSAAITEVPLFVVGVGVVALASGWAVLVGRVPALIHLATVVPALDFVALAVMRTASGGTASIVSGLVVLPVVWFAMESGRRNVIYASTGGLVVVIAPILATGVYLDSPGELLRGFFVAAVYAAAALAINAVSQQARVQMAAIRERDSARGEELARGGAAQQALLPGNIATLGPYRVAGVCLPARAVGGDFYDWYPTPDGYAITLGDVMGKGVGAGIIAATARAVVRSARFDADPITAVMRADECLATELIDMSPFATMFHARLSDDGELRYADAGHGLTLVRRRDGSWERLGSTDLPLGLGLPTTWSSQPLSLDHGEWLMAFSDGLLDLYGGDDRALAAIVAILLAAETPEGVIDALIASAGGMNQEDDVTVVALVRD